MGRAAKYLLALLTASIALLHATHSWAQASFPGGPNPHAVATFHSIGLYWYNPGGGTGTAMVEFKEQGSQDWRRGLDLWYDSRNAEYRGSLVELRPATTYDIRITRQGSTGTTLTATTWSENFPVPAGHSVTVPSGTTRIVINPSAGSTPTTSTSGTTFTVNAPTGSAGYTRISAAAGQNVVVGSTVSDECILINHGVRNVVIADLVLRDCRRWGIRFLGGSAEPRTENIVIDGNEFVGWGSFNTSTGFANNDGAISCNFSAPVKPQRVVMQRNVFRDPRHGSNPWGPNQVHPLGPQALYFSNCGGNHVLRYNDIHANGNGNHYNDAIGGGSNFSNEGSPGPDSDIYGNSISHVFDDAIESEGGNRNVRIWGNYMTRTFVAIGLCATRIGPLYVWRNVSDRMELMRDPNGDSDTEGRAQFVKGGDNGDGLSGRAYYFHNTLLQAPPPPGKVRSLGAGGGLHNVDGVLFNFVSKNNIWHIHRTDRSSIRADCHLGFCESNFDLYNGTIVNAGPTTRTNGESWRGPGTPIYQSSGTSYPNQAADPGNFSLASTSPGRGEAALVFNFNDQYFDPDIGAHQSSTPAMKFGVLAGLEEGPGAAAQPVFDDFEDGDAAGWTLSSGSWSVVADGASKVLKQSNPSGGARASLDVSNSADHMIEADVKVESFNGTEGWAGLFVRYTQINATTNNTYYITLRNSNSLSLRKSVDGVITIFGTHAMTVSVGTTYRLRLEAVGSALKAYVNGELVLSATDSELTSGRAAIGTFMAVASFDNILVTPTPLNALGFLQDNFKDGDSLGWTQIGSSPWSVTASNGNNVLSQSDTTGGNRAIRAESYWRDQSIEADVTITGVAAIAAPWAGLFVRFTDNNTYYVTLRYGENRLSLRKSVNGVITELASASFAVGINTTYKVRLEATGPNLKVYVDGALMLQATDTTLVAGRAGVGNFRASAHFDSIVVSARAPTVMSDNFEDQNANGWTPGGAHSWSVVADGTWVYKQSNGSAGAFSIFAGSSPNQTIQARVKALSFSAPDNWVGLAARYADANNHYYITARSSSNELHLRKTVGGVFGTLASVAFPIATGLWYKFRLEVLDTPTGATELRVYVDTNDGTGWKLLIEHTDPTPLTAGNDFGIRMFGATAEYDDVVVTTP
jgi:hypothetical protein